MTMTDERLADYRRVLLQQEADLTRLKIRVEALEAAARQINVNCRVPRGDYWGDACRWCDNSIDTHGHRPNCPVGVLLPLLEDV